ncbi:CHASE3 domain-containing protein [Methylobacterium komagatae]
MGQYLVRRANVLVLVVPLIFLGLIGALSWERLNASRDARKWSQHSYAVLATMKDLAIALRDAERGQRGYVLTGKDEYLSPYREGRDRIAVLQGELQKLTADNDTQQGRLRALAPVVQHKLEELAQTVQARRDGGFEAALRIVDTDDGRNHMREAEAVLAAMLADEQRLLDERVAENDARAAWVRWLVVAGSVLAVLTLLWAARLLNEAWSRSYRTEAEQRYLALRLRTTLDSLSQGVAVFGPDRRLASWNQCFQVLLDLPKAMTRSGTPYGALAERTAEPGRPALETEDQIRHGSRNPREAVTYERERADGHHLEIRRTPMPDGGFVLTISDMTKRAQAEGVLREAQKMQAIGS